MQGAYFQWCKGVGGDCSVVALCRRIDARKQIGNTQLLHRQIGPIGGILLPPTAPWYPIGDGRFGQTNTQRVWRHVWHQTEVYLHKKDGTYSPEGKGKAESEDCHLPPGNELITATLKALGGCDDAQNKRPLYWPWLISLFFGIFPSLRGGDFILEVTTSPTYKNITNFVRENKIPNMSEKQPQVLIFNVTGELVAIARSIRSAAELTKVDENDIKLCCENRQSIYT